MSPVAGNSVPEPANPDLASATDDAEGVIPPIAPSVDQVPAPAQDTLSQGDATETAVWLGILASALGVIGLGVLGALALRRRRVGAVPIDVVERPKVSDRQATSAGSLTPPVVPNSDPGRADGTVTTAAVQPVAAPARIESAGFAPIAPQARERQPVAMTGYGATAALPRELPRDPAEREALLERMVAAKPDRANPFVSRKARRKRARLILQSFGRRFENGRSRIDLSQYPQHWPELAQPRPAAA